MFRFEDCAWVEGEAKEETEERKGEEKVKEREEPAWDAVRQKVGHRRIVLFGEDRNSWKRTYLNCCTLRGRAQVV